VGGGAPQYKKVKTQHTKFKCKIDGLKPKTDNGSMSKEHNTFSAIGNLVLDNPF